MKPSLEGQRRQSRSGQLLHVGQPILKGAFTEGLELVVTDLHDEDLHRRGEYTYRFGEGDGVSFRDGTG
jgi:hypothetical protein